MEAERCGSPMCERSIGPLSFQHRSPFGRCACAKPKGHDGAHVCDTPNDGPPEVPR